MSPASSWRWSAALPDQNGFSEHHGFIAMTTKLTKITKALIV